MIKFLWRPALWQKGKNWIITGTVGTLVVALRLSGLLQILELAAYDALLQLRPQELDHSRIVIVGFDEEDLEAVGGWPISDVVLADLLNKINAQDPVAIGLDIYRDVPVKEGYEQLEEAMRSANNLIGIQKVVGDQGTEGVPGDRAVAIAPPPVLAELDQVASNDLPWDIDGKTRRVFVYLTDYQGNTVLGIGFKLAWLYLSQEANIEPETINNNTLVKVGDKILQPLEPASGGYVREDTAGYQILINYRGPKESFKFVSMRDVLAGKVDEDVFRDRIVLIGSTAPSLKDFVLTPYSDKPFQSTQERMAGVEVIANTASSLISAALGERGLITTLPEGVEILWIFLWSGVGTMFVCRWRMVEDQAKISFVRTGGVLMLSSGLLVAVVYGAFLGSWWLPSIPPLQALWMAAIVKMGVILAENLQRSYRKIEEYARTLEIKVEQRTEELRLKNHELEQTNDELEHTNNELEHTLNQLKTAQKQMIAQEKLAFLGSLTAGIAHEIRNPLNFVNNFARISLELTEEIKEEIDAQNDNFDEETQETLEEIFGDIEESVGSIHQHGKRIEGIIEQMMMHAHDERGKPMPTDVNHLLTEALDLVYHNFTAKAKPLETDVVKTLDESVPQLQAIAQDLSRAFMNIFQNSFEAVYRRFQTQTEGYTPQVTLKTENLSDRILITIRDNGDGIPLDNIDKIFTPFFTTKPTGEGTGLGLSLVHETIASLHQGEISVDSVQGEYTELTILFPKEIFFQETEEKEVLIS